eukprot:SAG31_NODE_524_length_14529_cov_23.084130_11_plen_113_part_00
MGGIVGRGEGEEVSRPQDGREAPPDGAVVEKGSGLHGGGRDAAQQVGNAGLGAVAEDEVGRLDGKGVCGAGEVNDRIDDAISDLDAFLQEGSNKGRRAQRVAEDAHWKRTFV